MRLTHSCFTYLFLLLATGLGAVAGRDLLAGQHVTNAPQQKQQLQLQHQGLRAALLQPDWQSWLLRITPGPPRQLAAGLACPEGCVTGSCVNATGTVRCTECIKSLVVNKTSGECACPMGRYAPEPGSCVDCDKGFYCPGGPYSITALPPRIACPTNMTTLGRRSTSNKACVNLPGYYYDANFTAGLVMAMLCPENTYGPGLKKQRACVPCPPFAWTEGQPGRTHPSACTSLVCVKNPCANVTNSTGVCIASVGLPNFKCNCTEGFTWDTFSVTCRDTDGCLDNTCASVANSTGECVDVPAPGSGYACGCKPFFAWNSTSLSCTANSPCATNPCDAVANSTGNCSTVDGGLGYNCSCQEGFGWNSTTGTCAVLDPCRDRPCDQVAGANGTCTAAPGGSSYSCGCTPGLMWNTGSKACTGCPPGLGGPDCSPCPIGTYQPGDSTVCRPCPAGTVAPVGSPTCIDASIAVGGDHVCAVVTPELRPLCGRLDSGLPAAAPLDLTNVSSICAGDNHSCATSNGTVVCWGDNQYRQSAPPPGLTDALLARCGSTFTCVLTATRKVLCFGSWVLDPLGQAPPEPVSVPDTLSSNVGQLAVGASHMCVTLLGDAAGGVNSRVVCLGNGNATIGLPANTTADLVAAFQNVTCIGSRGGNLSCYGGTQSLGETPIIPGSGVVDVVGGQGFAVARLSGGLLNPWGPAAASLSLPADSNASAVSAANQTACVRVQDGGVVCYGTGKDYLLETFSVGSDYTSPEAAAAACATYGATLATLRQLQRDWAYGAEWCKWGYVADANATGAPMLAYPMQQGNFSGCSDDGARVYTTAAGNGTAAAAICWGHKPVAELLPFNLKAWSLLGGRRNFTAPTVCKGFPPPINLTTWLPSCDGMAAGGLCRGACAPRFSGLPLASCGLSGVWMNVSGSCSQIPCGPGLGGPDCTPCPPNTWQKGDSIVCKPCPPDQYSPTGSSMCFDTRLAVGATHSCAVVGTQRQVICDGKPGTNGRLNVPANLTNVTSICAGFDHTCAVTNGAVVCWGDNQYNQTTPPPGIIDAVLVRCGELISCALTASRRVLCWGVVQVDTVDFQQVLGPLNLTDAALNNVGQLSVGWHHVCTAVPDAGSMGSAGRVYCAGYPQALELFPENASTYDILGAFWAVIVLNIRGIIYNISGFKAAIGKWPLAANGAVEVTGGNGFALARMKTGELVLWGANAPAMGVPNITTTAVATYDSHLCVRHTNGTILCFGADKDSQHLRESFAVRSGPGFNNETGYADSKAAAAACISFGAKLATLAQLQRDYGVGAEWCGWGYTADKDGTKPILAYPMQAGGVQGCSEQGALVYTTSVVPANTTVMAVCYGKKPPLPLPGVLPFNNGTWSILGPADLISPVGPVV